MKKAFAKLFDVHESEIDERDLPIVAMAGSGGGFRAMINTTGSLIGAKESGLLDCVTYISGISGMPALILVSTSLSLTPPKEAVGLWVPYTPESLVLTNQ